MLYHHPLPLFQWGTVLGASLVAAVYDVRLRRIPNLLTGPLLATGLIAAIAVGGWRGLADALAACVMLAVPFVLLYALGGGGAGDAKLMGALGAWLGVGCGAVVLVAVCLAGVVQAFGYAWAGNRLKLVLGNLGRLARSALIPIFGGGSSRDLLLPKAAECQKMPYGPAIFAGVVISSGAFSLWHV